LNVSMNTQERNHLVGTIAQYRQGFFVNCWHLFAEETARMVVTTASGIRLPVTCWPVAPASTTWL
jgi:hypothetical protein